MVHIDNGLYNGYVAVPKGHPWFGKSCDDLMHLNVHGGITYSETESDEWHVVGFDTCHHGDTASEWDVQAVAKEAQSLLHQSHQASYPYMMDVEIDALDSMQSDYLRYLAD